MSEAKACPTCPCSESGEDRCGSVERNLNRAICYCAAHFHKRKHADAYPCCFWPGHDAPPQPAPERYRANVWPTSNDSPMMVESVQPATTEDDCSCPCHGESRQCGNCRAGRHNNHLRTVQPATGDRFEEALDAMRQAIAEDVLAQEDTDSSPGELEGAESRRKDAEDRVRTAHREAVDAARKRGYAAGCEDVQAFDTHVAGPEALEDARAAGVEQGKREMAREALAKWSEPRIKPGELYALLESRARAEEKPRD